MKIRLVITSIKSDVDPYFPQFFDGKTRYTVHITSAHKTNRGTYARLLFPSGIYTQAISATKESLIEASLSHLANFGFSLDDIETVINTGV